ncbi:unnamed protein product [Heligmosomoides polygyrus]|uniref:Sulfotransfer_1 domain-containing protein n=1 Tax=Heligmosomoides polygyrus TaxID=6339 RepID=A0A183GRQ5_HELPZ|nr:unnamed protein product [Heligmosomoides polygyrus]
MISLNRNQLLFCNLCVLVLLFIYIHSRLNTTLYADYPKIPSLIHVDPQLEQIVIYNRVPKTGSTTFTNAVAYDLFKLNGFNVIHLNMTKNRQVMSLTDQSEFITNITSWKERLPAFYHVFDPLFFQLLICSLTFYPILLTVMLQTFDECVARSGRDCDMKQMWLQIPYFCVLLKCSFYLFKAKKNLLDKYLLVGISEQIRDFIAVLERLVPRFFKGALEHFDGLSDSRSHLRYTKRKYPPSDQTLSVIRRNEVYRLEKEFYEFAKEEFQAIFKKVTNGTNNARDVLHLKSQYHYEKIKPERPFRV